MAAIIDYLINYLIATLEYIHHTCNQIEVRYFKPLVYKENRPKQMPQADAGLFLCRSPSEDNEIILPDRRRRSIS
jgi:hypothetical protein